MLDVVGSSFKIFHAAFVDVHDVVLVWPGSYSPRLQLALLTPVLLFFPTDFMKKKNFFFGSEFLILR